MTCHCYEHKCIFFCQEHFKFEYTSALHVKVTILLQTENDEIEAVKTNPGNTDEIQVIMFVFKKKKIRATIFTLTRYGSARIGYIKQDSYTGRGASFTDITVRHHALDSQGTN